MCLNDSKCPIAFDAVDPVVVMFCRRLKRHRRVRTDIPLSLGGGDAVAHELAICGEQAGKPISVGLVEVVQSPRSWTERAYPNLIYYNKVDKMRTLRGLGTATTVLRVGSGGLQVAPLGDALASRRR